MERHHLLMCLTALCLSIVQSATITVYEPRRRCPNTEEKWRERVAGYICPPQTQYHCMLTGDGEIVEFCSDITWIEHDFCPVFNSKTGSIDVQLCPENADCPRKQYLSNTVYKYPECLQKFRKASDSGFGGTSLASTKIREKHEGVFSVEPFYNVTMMRLTSIYSMVFMAINFLLILFIVVMVLIYPRVRKGMTERRTDKSVPKDINPDY